MPGARRVSTGAKGATPRKDTTYRKHDPPREVKRASPSNAGRARAGVLFDTPRRAEASARRQEHYAQIDLTEAEDQASRAAAAGQVAAESISQTAQDLLLAKQSAEEAVELAAQEIASVTKELETFRALQARKVNLSVQIPPPINAWDADQGGETEEEDTTVGEDTDPNQAGFESASEPEFEPLSEPEFETEPETELEAEPQAWSEPAPERPRTSRRCPNPTPDMFADYVITSPRGTKHRVYGKLEAVDPPQALQWDFAEDVRESVTSVDSMETGETVDMTFDNEDMKDDADGVLVLDPELTVTGQGLQPAAAAPPAPAPAGVPVVNTRPDVRRAAAGNLGRQLFGLALAKFEIA